MSNAISAKHLNLKFGSKTILEEISFSIEQGSSVCIIGPNGAGKSSLLKSLIRIENHTTGELRICDQLIERYSQKQLARLMGYVPQSDSPSFAFTVSEFIKMGRYPHLSPFTSLSETDQQIVEEVFELTETDQLQERLLTTLSGGERQRVMIAAALVQEPEILLLDEPTTFLDYQHQQAVAKLLKQITTERKLTLLCVSHDINQAVLLCERIIALKNGRIVFDGAASQVMTPEVLSEIYDTEFLFAKHPNTGSPVVVPHQQP